MAHCGGNTNGQFLNTMTLVDICTGWLEVMPQLRKSAQDVIGGLRVADDLLPFRLQGLDTDCGSEFINYDVLDYCEDNCITFTRARTHRKNDQAHVEEKNGSFVRRLVGYDRYKGTKAWEALAQLYALLRKYENCFQPSLKLRNLFFTKTNGLQCHTSTLLGQLFFVYTNLANIAQAVQKMQGNLVWVVCRNVEGLANC